MRTPDPDREAVVYDPAALRERLNRTMKRRLSDDVESLFNRACLVSDLDTAEELLTLLKGMLEREGQKFARDRRFAEDLIERLTDDLRQRQHKKRAKMSQMEAQALRTGTLSDAR